MTKKQSWIINLIIIVAGYIVPLVYLNTYNDFRRTETVQWSVFITLLIGSLLLTFLNWGNKEKIDVKTSLVFKIVGVLGILYSVMVIYLLFAFRKGISF